MTAPKVVFTHHCFDRLMQKLPDLSALSVRPVLANPSNWLTREFDNLYGDNKRDGVKMRVTIRVDGKLLKAVVVKKVEEGRPTYIVLTVHL